MYKTTTNKEMMITLLSDVSGVLLWNQAQAATRNEATSSFSPSKMALQERYKSGWYVAERQRITV